MGITEESDLDRVLAIRWRLKSELADAAYELAIDLQTGDQLMINPRYVLDATEEADLLPLRECGWVVGAESASRIGEPHVLDGSADPWDEQAITRCAALRVAAGRRP